MFLQVLNMSFTGSIVIVLVLLARLLLKKVPKKFSYLLWSVVLFRLVCPFSFESILSLLPTKAAPIPQDIVYQQTPQINTGIPIINSGINAILPAATPYSSVNPLQVWAFIGCLIWVIGIISLLVYSLVSLFKLKRKLRDSVCEGGNIYIVKGLLSPFVMGIIYPKIYLPDHLTPDEKRYILLHEQTHIKRFDHLVKLVSFAVLCVHWFNPLVWVAFFSCGKDMEMSCDEAVIKQLGDEVKKDYSSSLLSLATGRNIVGGSPLAFGEGDTKGRIKNVLNYKKPAFWVIIVAIIAVICVVVGLMANPVQSPANDTPIVPQSDDTPTDTAFTAVTITEHSNGDDINTVEVADKEIISTLQALVSSGTLTTKASIQDAPNDDSYIHIAFKPTTGTSDYYIYEDDGSYYIEQPYNGISGITVSTLDKILSISSDAAHAKTEPPSTDVLDFLREISESFKIKEGMARFIVPMQMPNGYDFSQLSVNVSGFMPIEDGSNMSLHAYEKEEEARSWEPGKEYIERMFDYDVPDGTEVNAYFRIIESDDVSYYTNVSKVFPLQENYYTPSVSVSAEGTTHTATFSDEFNDKLSLTCILPDGWSLKSPSYGNAQLMHESIGIYAGDVKVGNLFHEAFTLYRDENDNIPYMSVYNGIMLGSVESWDNEYVEIYKDDITSVATCKPRRNLQFPGISNAGAPTVYSNGILAYNVDASKYIAINLVDNAVTEDQWQAIAKSVKLTSKQMQN